MAGWFCGQARETREQRSDSLFSGKWQIRYGSGKPQHDQFSFNWLHRRGKAVCTELRTRLAGGKRVTRDRTRRESNNKLFWVAFTVRRSTRRVEPTGRVKRGGCRLEPRGECSTPWRAGRTIARSTTQRRDKGDWWGLYWSLSSLNRRKAKRQLTASC